MSHALPFAETVNRTLNVIVEKYKLKTHEQINKHLFTQYRSKIKPMLNKETGIEERVHYGTIKHQIYYIFWPLGEAANNSGIICKKYYLQAVMNEMEVTLGISKLEFISHRFISHISHIFWKAYSPLPNTNSVAVLLKHNFFNIKHRLKASKRKLSSNLSEGVHCIQDTFPT